MTVAEYAEWGTLPENSRSRDELIDGVIVPLPPHHRIRGIANALIGSRLCQHFEGHTPGYATVGAGVILSEDTVLSVDVAVYPWAYEDYCGPGGWCDRTPATCVDIVSPWDRVAQLQKRVVKYHAAGVLVVWNVHPEDRAVTVHRRGCGVESLEGDDVLTAEPESPGFSCRVSEFFTTRKRARSK